MTSINSNTYFLPVFISIFLVIAIVLFIVMYTSDRKKAKEIAAQRAAKQQALKNASSAQVTSNPSTVPIHAPSFKSVPSVPFSNIASDAASVSQAPTGGIKVPASTITQPQTESEAVSETTKNVAASQSGVGVIPLTVLPKPESGSVSSDTAAASQPETGASDPKAVSQTASEQTALSKGNIFYVFITQGRSFASGGTSTEEVAKEKAQKLKDDYLPAKDMELVLVSPGTWENPGSGSSASEKLSALSSGDAIREYLTTKGVSYDKIEAGLSISAEASLKLTNLGSGLSFIGIPIR